jgi:hypothetical protein
MGGGGGQKTIKNRKQIQIFILIFLNYHLHNTCMLQIPCRCCDAARWKRRSQIFIRQFEPGKRVSQQIAYGLFLLMAQTF